PALSFYGVGNFAVTGTKYRLIQYEDGSQEFYNLQDDPNEWNNLAFDEKLNEDKEKLEAYIPVTQAPLSKYSSYNINAYFRQKLSEN
ncbi:MAG: sulfatase, partial [Cyclobacteriaceae bacterium]|nr:sulfatase [Cyclobacteriaceae bacterium]